MSYGRMFSRSLVLARLIVIVLHACVVLNRYRSWWLSNIPDSSPDKTFETGDSHIVHIVQSWEPPAPIQASNTS